MARRRTDLGPAVPEQLARLVVSEWPAAGGDWRAAYEAWKAARLDWVCEHPDTLLGDSVDVLRGCVRVRLARLEEGF